MEPSTFSLIHQGHSPEAQTLLERQLAEDPANSMRLGQNHPSLLSTLASLDHQDLPLVLGDEAATHAFNPTAMVTVDHLSLGAEFRQVLIETLRHHHSLVGNRPNKLTTGGSQTYELFDGDEQGLFAPLGQHIIELAVKKITTLPAQALPFINLPTDPTQIRISGWGVILGSGGFQKPHTHSESQISGVLYLQVPVACRLSSAAAGNLRFPYLLKGQSLYYDTAPAVDTIIFFPSYLRHGTVPFVDSEERTCIAFNLN